MNNFNKGRLPALEIDRNKIKSIVETGFDKDTIRYAEEIGTYITDVSTSQIRNAYGELTRIKMKSDSMFSLHDLLMLKPKLAYAVGRAHSNKNQYVYLANNLYYAIDVVAGISKDQQISSFNNFASFFEAILAYHKANGGK
jgi:CRISPR-associated protein Csm2